MKHGSLFSGIGGFDLAAQWAGWENVFQVEIDTWCQKILKKNFPNAQLYSDIRNFDGTAWCGAVDVISGGFPCQPFSTSGKRLGKEDKRHLWPEMLRIIQEVKPTWVVGENVRGLVNWSKGLVLEEVCADLEASGYEVQPFLLPAAGVNAPHQRQRIWVIAYSKSCNDRRNTREFSAENGRQERNNLSEFGRTGKIYDSSNANFQRLQRFNENKKGIPTTHKNTWDKFPTQSAICGGNDGVPNRMDRIRGLGNAVVPQLVYQIFETINSFNCE